MGSIIRKKSTRNIVILVIIVIFFLGGFGIFKVMKHNSEAQNRYQKYSEIIDKNKASSVDSKDKLEIKLKKLNDTKAQISEDKSSLRIFLGTSDTNYNKLSKEVDSQIKETKSAISLKKHEEELDASLKEAQTKVSAAESSKSEDDINEAQKFIDKLSDNEQKESKNDLNKRIETLKQLIVEEKEKKEAEKIAEEERKSAEISSAPQVSTQSDNSYVSSEESNNYYESDNSSQSTSGGSSSGDSSSGGGWVNVRPENNGQFGTASDESMVPEGAVVQP